MNLHDQLTEKREASAQNLPKEIHQVMMDETAALSAKELEQFAPKKGDVFPSFALKDQTGTEQSLQELTKNGPVIVTFYRGGWCPYCNLELRAYQNVLSDIKEAGAQLVAISPELPDASLTTAQKNELEYTVLSDPNAEFAKSLGIVFSLPESLKPIYESFGIHVEQHNGEGQFDLPLAATFVIGKDGKVAFADVHADYTRRTEPSDVVELLSSIS